MAHSNLFTQQIGGAQGSSAGAGIFRTRERHMLGMPPLEQQIYGGAGRGPEQEPEQLGNPNVMDEVNDMLNYDLIDDLLDFTAAEIESEPFLFDHHTAPKIDEIQVNSTVLPTVDIDPHTLEIPPLENSFRQCDDLNGPGLEWLSNFIDQCCAPLEVGIMMKSADYYSGKASADDGKQISQLPNPSSIPAHQSISNQQRLIDDDKDKDNCIVVENGPPLPPPALPSVSPSSSSSSSMNTGSKAPIIISNSSGIFTTLTNRGRAPRTKRRKFIPKHPLNKRPVDFPIPALECDITEERQSKKLKTVHPSSTSVEINLPPTPSSQPHLVPCQKDEETIRNCSHCRAVVTPQWRAGPMGPKTLCNACGVRYKSGRLFPEYRPSASPTFEESRHSNNHKKVVELRGMNANVAKDVKTPASTKGCELLNYINDGCRK